MIVCRLHNFDFYPKVLSKSILFQITPIDNFPKIGNFTKFPAIARVDVATSSVRTQLMMMCLAE